MNNKQGIYGFIFLLVLLGIGFLVYQAFFKPAGSCTDGILNQGEEKIDCGGASCTPCDIVALEPLRITKEPKVLATDNVSIAIFEILNSNKDYNAKSFPYTLRIYESGGRVIEEISGEASVPALRRKLVLEGGVRTFSKSIARIELLIGEPVWDKSFSALFPELSISSGPNTIATGTIIRVTGKVKNEGSLDESDVEIIAIVMDQYGKELFASRSRISLVPSLSEREWSVAFPQSESLSRLISPTRTKIIIQTN